MKRVARPLLLGLAAAGWTATRFRGWRRQRTTYLARGVQIAHTRHGPIEYVRRGRGPTLLLCHGGPGGWDQAYMLDALMAAGFQIVAPSRPGYLGTPLRVGATIEAQADAMAALLDALDIAQAAVVGVSAGGPIALQLALRHPQRVWGVVLLSAVTRAYRPNADAVSSPLGRLYLSEAAAGIADAGTWLLDRFTARFPAQSAHAMIATESTLSPTEVRQKVADIMVDPAQVAAYQQLVRSTVPLSPRRAGIKNDLAQLASIRRYPLEKIDAPAFVTHGRFDADVPYEHATFAASALPNATLVTQMDSGHLIWLGREWGATLPRLVTFLEEQAPQPPVVPPPTIAEQLRAELEATRLAYHALLADLPADAWEHPTGNAAWNVRQVLTHMLLAPELLPQDVRLIRSGGTVQPPMWLFHRLNDAYTRWRARGQTAASLARQYDAAHARILALMDTIGADEWQLAGTYPNVNANLPAGEHTLEAMFRYLTRHVAEHTAEIRQTVAV